MSGLTVAERRRVQRRGVGRLDDGRPAFLVHKGDSEAVARAVFDNYDPELIFDGQLHVDWCHHTDQYRYDHGCDEWCENPSPSMVWVAHYPPQAPEVGR